MLLVGDSGIAIESDRRGGSGVAGGSNGEGDEVYSCVAGGSDGEGENGGAGGLDGGRGSSGGVV